MPGGWFTSSCGWARRKGPAPGSVRGMGTALGTGLLGFHGSVTHCVPRAPRSPQQPSRSRVSVAVFQAVSIISGTAHERRTGIVPTFQINKRILSEAT